MSTKYDTGDANYYDTGSPENEISSGGETPDCGKWTRKKCSVLKSKKAYIIVKFNDKHNLRFDTENFGKSIAENDEVEIEYQSSIGQPDFKSGLRN